MSEHLLASAENETHKLEIFQDQDAESPRENDNVGTFLVWHREVVSPDKNDYPAPSDFLREWFGEWYILDLDRNVWESGINTESDAKDLINQYGGDTVLTIHHDDGTGEGGILLPVDIYPDWQYSYGAGDPITDASEGFDHDGGFIFATADTLKTEGFDLDHAARYLTGEVEEYSRWAQGEAFGYVCSEKVAKHVETTHQDGTVTTFDYSNWDVTDSCWGFLGYDSYRDIAGELTEPFNELAKEL